MGEYGHFLQLHNVVHSILCLNLVLLIMNHMIWPESGYEVASCSNSNYGYRHGIRRPGNVKCWACGEFGHKQNVCPLNMVCRICGDFDRDEFMCNAGKYYEYYDDRCREYYDNNDIG